MQIDVCELYAREVLELLPTLDLDKGQIARLMRVLVYLLSSVDSYQTADRSRVVKVINNLLVGILEKLNFSSLVDSIFMNLKHEVQFGDSLMTLFLFVKCIYRLNKNVNYKGKEVSCYKSLIESTL